MTKLSWKLILKTMGYAALVAMNLYTLEILYSTNELFTFKGLIIIFGAAIWVNKLYQTIP